MRISDWSSDVCSSDLMNVQSGEMKAVWVGHATVLVQAGGLNILTDPIWSDYASPFPPLGPERVKKPGIRFEDLPKIDPVVVSHYHYDHMDLPPLERLWARASTEARRDVKECGSRYRFWGA